MGADLYMLHNSSEYLHARIAELQKQVACLTTKLDIVQTHEETLEEERKAMSGYECSRTCTMQMERIDFLRARLADLLLMERAPESSPTQRIAARAQYESLIILVEEKLQIYRKEHRL